MIEVHPYHELLKDIKYISMEIENNQRVASPVLERVFETLVESIKRLEEKCRSQQSQINHLKKEVNNE
jgi:predicted secreted Zn-dependent protease